MANKVYNMEGGLHSAAAFSSFENAMYGACVANASSYTISAGSGMNVVLSTGDALIPTGTGFARRIHSDSTNTISISTASSSYARKDAIVAYIDGSVSPTTTVVDNTNGILKFKSVAGSPSANPVAPSASAIQSSVGAGNPYIVLWYATVPKSASAMTGAIFEDNRSVANKVKSENLANGAVTEDKIASGVIAYATGDTEQVGVKNGADETLYMTSGMLTASNANVVFNITLPKSLKNVTRLTLTDSQVWIRHTGGGYLANNVSLASTSTVTLGKVSDNTIGVKAVKTGGWGGTNNTPVSIAGYFKISFN